MVQNLNLIMITSPELSDFRKRLRTLDSKDGQNLFVTLYRSWSHNAVATFTLCLLAQAYEQASALLQILCVSTSRQPERHCPSFSCLLITILQRRAGDDGADAHSDRQARPADRVSRLHLWVNRRSGFSVLVYVFLTSSCPTALRLQLLEPDKHPYLLKAMYGLLMLLPQSSAFATLRNRLSAVSSLGFLQTVPR